MIKHLIEFDGKKIALDRQEIIQLQSALEPYVIGIMNVVKDEDIPKFVSQYRSNVAKKRKMVKERKNLTVEEENVQNKTEHHEDNVFDLSFFRERNKNKANG